VKRLRMPALLVAAALLLTLTSAQAQPAAPQRGGTIRVGITQEILNLDPHVANEIQKLLVGLHRAGMTVFMATHDYRIVKKFPSRTLALSKGQLVEVSPEML